MSLHQKGREKSGGLVFIVFFIESLFRVYLIWVTNVRNHYIAEFRILINLKLSKILTTKVQYNKATNNKCTKNINNLLSL